MCVFFLSFSRMVIYNGERRERKGKIGVLVEVNDIIDYST